jgi:NosR/NirI family transcriptional regulator, nitrous oxide reductase regulator
VDPDTILYNSPKPEGVLQRLFALVTLVVGFGTLALGQQTADPQLLARLKTLFPGAVSFSPKEGDPPHFTAYGQGGRGSQPVLGYAFWTTEAVPLERGYGGPIPILVGIDTRGILTGVVVGEHHEPYGDFSIDRPEFPAQFRGKNVRDPFKLGGDVDAVSRATITMSAAVRTIRNGSRRIARSLIAPPAEATK